MHQYTTHHCAELGHGKVDGLCNKFKHIPWRAAHEKRLWKLCFHFLAYILNTASCYNYAIYFSLCLLSWNLTLPTSPKERLGMSMSTPPPPPSLESQGCHLISLNYLPFCSSAYSHCSFCLVLFPFCLLAHSPDFFAPENSSIFFKKSWALWYGSCIAARRW